MNDQISQNIVKFRKKAGLSQEELAEKLHLTRQTISKWETGNSAPDVDSVALLCRTGRKRSCGKGKDRLVLSILLCLSSSAVCNRRGDVSDEQLDAGAVWLLCLWHGYGSDWAVCFLRRGIPGNDGLQIEKEKEVTLTRQKAPRLHSRGAFAANHLTRPQNPATIISNRIAR